MNTKAICPNCGAEGTAGRFCEYCGTKIPMPKPKHKKKSHKTELSTVRMVNFTINQDEAIKAFLCYLSDVDNLPKDTFDRLTIDEITPYLIPTYFYHCNFDAPWSCIKLVHEKYKVGNETKTRTKRYPMNGIAQRGFDYVLPSCKIEDIPTELYAFIKDEMSNLAYYDLSDDYELDEKDKSILVESSDDDENMVLRKSDFNSILDRRVSSAVKSQIPNDYEDLSYSYSYNNSIGKELILPFWLIRYTYKDEKFYFIIDGINKNDRIKRPEDSIKKAEISALKKQEENKGYISCFASLLWLIFFLGSVLTTISFFIHWVKNSDNIGTVTAFHCFALVGMIIFYVWMHKASKKELDAKNVVQSNLHSDWLQKKESLLNALTSKDFKLSTETTKQLIDETKKRIKEKNPNIEQEDKEKLSKVPTIVVEILGWISLLVYSILG